MLNCEYSNWIKQAPHLMLCNVFIDHMDRCFSDGHLVCISLLTVVLWWRKLRKWWLSVFIKAKKIKLELKNRQSENAYRAKYLEVLYYFSVLTLGRWQIKITNDVIIIWMHDKIRHKRRTMIYIIHSYLFKFWQPQKDSKSVLCTKTQNHTSMSEMLKNHWISLFVYIKFANLELLIRITPVYKYLCT